MNKSQTQQALEKYLDNRQVIKELERQLRVAKAEKFLYEKHCPWLLEVQGQLEKHEEEEYQKNPPNPLQELMSGGLSEQAARNFVQLDREEKERKRKAAAEKLAKKLEKNKISKMDSS